MDNKILRRELTEQLRGGSAHLPADRILHDVSPENRHRKAAPSLHTVWELLEHLRICQEDILNYCTDPAWQSPEWPGGYWPDASKTPADADWQASVNAFLRNLNRAVILANDPAVNIMAEIPHSPGHTFLREILLIADHNAYHLGQIVLIRKMLSDLPE